MSAKRSSEAKSDLKKGKLRTSWKMIRKGRGRVRTKRRGGSENKKTETGRKAGKNIQR